jgi:hypothetical protein
MFPYAYVVGVMLSDTVATGVTVIDASTLSAAIAFVPRNPTTTSAIANFHFVFIVPSLGNFGFADFGLRI